MGRTNKLSTTEINTIFEKFGVEWSDIMAREIKEIKIEKLKPHPQNDLIYGQEDVSDLIGLIEARGKIIDPLIVKEDFTIISGHRRWKAAQALGYKTVPCETRSYDNEEDEIADLVLSNVDRIKTNEQMAREGLALEQTLSVEALTRKLARLKQNRTDMDELAISEDAAQDNAASHEKGLTRDKVAKAIGLRSGKTYDRMKDAIKKADTLKSEGKDDDFKFIIAVLNERTATAASDLSKISFEILSSEDRKNIKAGKVAPRFFIPKVEVVQAPKKKSFLFEEMKEEFSTTSTSMKKLAKSVSRTNDLEEGKWILSQIEILKKLITDIESGLKLEDEKETN